MPSGSSEADFLLKDQKNLLNLLNLLIKNNLKQFARVHHAVGVE